MPTPADLAYPLADTIRAEEDALVRLDTLVTRQLEAVRGHHAAGLDVLTTEAANASAELQKLRATRDRQTRLLARVLKLDGDAATLEDIAAALEPLNADAAHTLRSARSRVRTLAARARQNADTLGYALQYAVSLGREVIHVLQGIDSPEGLRTYTSAGQRTTAAPQRSFLNQIG